MWRADSDNSGLSRMKCGGYTLIALLVGLVIAALAVIAVGRLFQSSMRSYSSQQRFSTNTVSCRNSMEMIADMVRQAGCNMPDVDSVIAINAKRDTLTMKVNPSGAIYTIPATIIGTKVYVQDAAPFYGSTSALKQSNDNPPKYETLALSGVDTVHDTLQFSAVDTFYGGEVVFIQQTYRFFVDRGVYQLITSVNGSNSLLSENVDSMSARFYDSSGTQVTSWQTMQVCSLMVRARNPIPNASYTAYSDHCQRLALVRSIMLRNKL